MAQGNGFINPYLEQLNDEKGKHLTGILKRVESDSILKGTDWFFMNIAASEHSLIKDPNILMYERTLPEVLKIRELVEIKTACELAQHKDIEAKTKKDR